MLSGHRSRAIDAPMATVLAVLADVGNYPDWHPFFERVEPTRRDAEGRVIGADCRHNASVTTLRTSLEFVHAERSVTARRVSGDLRDLEGVFEVSEQGDATIVTHRLRVDPGVKLGLLLRGPVEERVRGRVIDGALDGLAASVAERA